jgi:hypothetical protein
MEGMSTHWHCSHVISCCDRLEADNAVVARLCMLHDVLRQPFRDCQYRRINRVYNAVRTLKCDGCNLLDVHTSCFACEKTRGCRACRLQCFFHPTDVTCEVPVLGTVCGNVNLFLSIEIISRANLILFKPQSTCCTGLRVSDFSQRFIQSWVF